MIIEYRNIWDHRGLTTIWRGIPTNGTVTRAGNAVMGRGVAQQAKDKYPGLAQELGKSIKILGGSTLIFMANNLIALPVKTHFQYPAQLSLIQSTVNQLSTFCNVLNPESRVLIPLLGCGAGGKFPAQVYPILSQLPDSVILCINHPEMYYQVMILHQPQLSPEQMFRTYDPLDK